MKSCDLTWKRMHWLRTLSLTSLNPAVLLVCVLKLRLSASLGFFSCHRFCECLSLGCITMNHCHLGLVVSVLSTSFHSPSHFQQILIFVSLLLSWVPLVHSNNYCNTGCCGNQTLLWDLFFYVLIKRFIGKTEQRNLNWGELEHKSPTKTNLLILADALLLLLLLLSLLPPPPRTTTMTIYFN